VLTPGAASFTVHGMADPLVSLRRAVAEAGGQRKLAHKWGMSNTFVSLMLKRERGVTARVAELLGLRRVVSARGVVTYRRAR